MGPTLLLGLRLSRWTSLAVFRRLWHGTFNGLLSALSFDTEKATKSGDRIWKQRIVSTDVSVDREMHARFCFLEICTSAWNHTRFEKAVDAIAFAPCDIVV